MAATSLTVEHVPDVSELHPPAGGDALVVSGYGATWDLDRVGDRFDPTSLDAALKTFMVTNPVVLYAHDRKLPPIGKVVEARIDRARGLWLKAILPRPPAGSWSEVVWHAARQGLLRAFSVAGRWFRQAAEGYNRIVAADLVEVSLAPVAVNGFAFADEVAIRHVKALADGTFADEQDVRRELEAYDALDQALDLASLQLDLIELRLRH